MISATFFYQAYGVNGLYYSDVDEEVTAVVIVKREDLTRLVAADKVLSYYNNSDIDYEKK